MDCCKVERGLNDVFDAPTARADAEEFRRKGLTGAARKLAEAVVTRGITGASVLEVGGGVGGLHLTLLQRGAASAHEVDISGAYIAEARSLAQKLNLAGRVTHQRADFAREGGSVGEAEVVVMHRVVCCYPDMPRLLTEAASHARRVLAFSFPWDGWPVRLGERVFGLWFALTRCDYRFHIHRWRDMQPLVAEAGFMLVQRTASFPWQIVVWERRGK